MTRVEVERECDRRGWKLEELVGLDVVNAPGPHYTVVEDDRRLGWADDPHAAFLAACKATDIVPF